jgi:hypothetical protein
MKKNPLCLAAFVAGLFAFMPAASAQQTFPTPLAAAEALIDGVARHDDAAVRTVLGGAYGTYLPVSKIDPDQVTTFLEAWAKSHRIVPSGDAKAYLEVGANGWTLPIPLVKGAAGWSFDTTATPDELRTRRIGRNELDVMQVMLAFADAQDDFRAWDRERNGRNDYAVRLVSTKGRHDGLYWPSRPGEPESPLGPLVAQAKAGGYYGYRFRMLGEQGSDAPGGAKRYVTPQGRVEGYALIAWPAKWGDTGVMTFIVNQDRTVYQKDLGPGTDALVREIREYNPDSSWTKATPK